VGDRGVASLLEALRSPGSCGDAWVEFLESYSPVLYQTAGACTSDDDAAADCYLFICEQLARNSFRRLLKFKPDGSASFATWRLASQVTPFRPIHLSWERIPGLAFCEYCTAIGLDVGTMNAVNQTIQCPAIFRFNWNSSLYYRVYMTGSWSALAYAPETTYVQIQCNSLGTNGYCNDWYIDPIPVSNGDGTLCPSQAIGRLVAITTRGTGTATNEGDFYMTFHVHVATP
jgi:hypothetical protein